MFEVTSSTPFTVNSSPSRTEIFVEDCGMCLIHTDDNNVTSRKYKWKNHFSEIKGDVGMSCHEKEREQDAHQDKVIYNPIPTSLFCDKNVALFVTWNIS